MQIEVQVAGRSGSDRSPRVVRGGGGSCPGCGQEGSFFVGLGASRFRLPISTSCRHCAMALTLLPC